MTVTWDGDVTSWTWVSDSASRHWPNPWRKERIRHTSQEAPASTPLSRWGGPEIQTITTASRTLQSSLPEPGFECRKSGPQSDAGNGGAAGPRGRGGGEAVLGLGVGAQLCRAVAKDAPERAPEPSKPHEAAVSPGVRGGEVTPRSAHSRHSPACPLVSAGPSGRSWAAAGHVCVFGDLHIRE